MGESAKNLRAQHEEDVTKQSAEAFATHEITERSVHNDLGRWVMHSRDAKTNRLQGCFWVEIVELRAGHLLVHGDITPVVFGMYYDKSQSVGSLVHWMGQRQKPSDSYMREKAHNGMSRDVTRSYEREIAVEDARRWYAEDEDGRESYERELKRSERFVKGYTFKAAFEEACRRVDNEECSREQAGWIWYDIINDPEVWGSWGLVTDPTFAHTWAAVRRLHTILLAEHEADSSKVPEGATV